MHAIRTDTIRMLVRVAKILYKGDGSDGNNNGPFNVIPPLGHGIDRCMIVELVDSISRDCLDITYT